MCTPHLQLETAFILNDDGRIASTREPGAKRGPLLSLVRSASACAWAVRADLPDDLAGELNRLAQKEPPVLDLHDAPVHADRYRSLIEDRMAFGAEAMVKIRRSNGPAFMFPAMLDAPTDVTVVEDERLLARNFHGWVVGEIAAGRSPVLAIVEDGYPVSVCFCARRSDRAAEAGLETAAAWRRRGFGVRVTAAWALAIRATGRIPLYSTAWSNDASLAIARKLGLLAYASVWSLSD